MKYLKSLNELNKETYVSAARKLAELEHDERAQTLLKHSKELKRRISTEEIDGDKFDIHNICNYPFLLNASWDNGPEVDDTYIISDTKIFKSEDESSCYIEAMMYSDSGDKKAISIELVYYEDDNENDNENEIIEYEQLWLDDYDDDGDHDDSWPGFRFSSRKDAVEFKRFLLKDLANFKEFSRELECFKNVSINKLYR